MVARIILSILIGLAAYAGLALRASQAHDWYDYDCCSDMDCYPIEAAELAIVPGGWRIRATNELIGWDDSKRRDSKDGRFHRCSYGGDRARKTICLYVPGAGM